MRFFQKPIDFSFWVWYNKAIESERNTKTQPKFEKKTKKPIDKSHSVWYNNYRTKQKGEMKKNENCYDCHRPVQRLREQQERRLCRSVWQEADGCRRQCATGRKTRHFPPHDFHALYQREPWVLWGRLLQGEGLPVPPWERHQSQDCGRFLSRNQEHRGVKFPVKK